jgi:hypothetical protein
MDSQIIVIRYPAWTIENTIKITHKPDQIAAAGNKLFIANSDTFFSFPVQDSVITVMDAVNPMNHHTLPIGLTPVDIGVDEQSELVYIACRGSSAIPGKIEVMNAQNEQIVHQIGKRICNHLSSFYRW